MIAAIIDAAIGRSRMVLSILVLIFVAGIYAWLDIPRESEPDIDIPQIYVSMALEGVSPEDAERLLLRPVEQELATIEGVKELKSAAWQGGGYVLLEFQAGFDKDKAMDDVQKGVDQVRPDLPDTLEREPQVTEVNFSLFPVLVVMLSGDVPERTLLHLARDLQDKIEAVPSVLEAGIAGDRDEQVEILIRPSLIESYGLDGIDILQFFDRSNKLVAAGSLDTGVGSFPVELPGLFENALDILDMPVRTRDDSVIRVRDVAELRRNFKDPENFARLNGKRAIAIEIVKRSGENIIDTIARVRDVVENERQFWPENVEVSYTQDRSSQIRTMLSDLQNNIISAILLVMVVMVAALGVRAAGLVGIAIPGAFLTGILALYVMGLSVNIVVLFALILSVGMLVDGAIVVTEYADRKMAEGASRRDAYGLAAKRMAWPVTASTATTLAAFAPLMFWPGIVGEFMKYLPLTLICVLGASLLMAMIFVPVLGSLIGKPGASSDPALIKSLAAAENGDLRDVTGLSAGYLRVLDWALRRPGKILLAALFLLIAVQMAYGKLGKGVEFFPDIEPDVATVLIHARGNLSVYEKDALVRDVESRILDVNGIKTFYTRSGKAAQQGAELAEDVIGQVQLELEDWDRRKKADLILGEIKERTAGIAGIRIETQKQEGGPPSGKDVQIQIGSRFPELLPEAARKMAAGLEELGGFADMEDGLPLPGIRWELQVDRAQASKFGLDISVIGQYVRMVTNGLKASEYRPDDSDDEIDVVIRHPVDERTLDQLDRVRIEGPDGSVPVSNFIQRVPRPAIGTIFRSGQKRVVTVKADVPPGENVTARIDEVKAWIDAHRAEFDPRLDIEFKGEDEDQREAQQFLVKAFVVALFIMAIILVTQFNSFYSTLLILSAVIMSTIGVFIGLIITGQPFGIVMSGIGVIALAGIIVNNNIVLIDTFDHMRRDYAGSMDVREMILRTGAQRLRPVLLTTVTTVLGLLPMVFQMNVDFIGRTVSVGAPSTQWWVQLSTAVAFGLVFSTVLTLVVTPCALMVRETMGMKWRMLGNKLALAMRLIPHGSKRNS